MLSPRCCCSPTGGSRRAGTPTRRGSRRRCDSATSSTSRRSSGISTAGWRPPGSPRQRSPPRPRRGVDRSQLDAELAARTLSPRLREVGRRLGRQLLRSGGGCGPTPTSRRSTGCQQPIVLGALVAAAGGDRRTTRRLVAMHHLAAAVDSAGVRLLGLDPLGVAAIQARAAPLIDDLVAPADDLGDRRRRPTCRRSAAPSPRSSARTTGRGPPGCSSPDTEEQPWATTTTHDHDHPPAAPRRRDRPLRIGIGGPVGSGKTTLVGALCVLLRDELSLAVVTNDIFTTEDAEALRRAAVLPTSESSPSRPDAARTRRSATTSPPTSTPPSRWRRRSAPVD